MARKTVLYVCHNHPAIRPGGAEAYAFELFEAMKDSDRYQPIFLARTGPPFSKSARYHDDTPFTGVDGDPDQYFLYTDIEAYDWFLGSMRNKPIVTRHFREFLEGHRPDVIHFHHTLFLGYEMVREARTTLPDAAIVYTLHEFLPICHRHGQLLRTGTEEPCMEESPRRCHECFPDIAPQEFFLRKRFIQSHLELVDVFLAPSHFLMERYVDWGIPREKIRFEDYGRHPGADKAPIRPRKKRDRLTFLGQLSHYKGITVLLEAMRLLLGEGVEARLEIHGANLEIQPEEFQEEFTALLDATEDNVAFAGQYDHEELPALMEATDWVMVPSIWWENSPLVIQEAFLHGRPVICSNIGGMAEKVTDGVDGLHFRAGDARSLADTIRRAVEDPNLWEQLRAGIRDIYRMDDHVAKLARLYEELGASRRGTEGRRSRVAEPPRSKAGARGATR
jgi:glycosyltransferase involved in cell wall biosynthesis